MNSFKYLNNRKGVSEYVEMLILITLSIVLASAVCTWFSLVMQGPVENAIEQGVGDNVSNTADDEIIYIEKARVKIVTYSLIGVNSANSATQVILGSEYITCLSASNRQILSLRITNNGIDVTDSVVTDTIYGKMISLVVNGDIEISASVFNNGGNNL